jgi:hypothetical protein
MCFKEEESIDHLFQGCEYAKEIRAYIHDNTQNRIQPSSRYRRGDIAIIIKIVLLKIRMIKIQL